MWKAFHNIPNVSAYRKRFHKLKMWKGFHKKIYGKVSIKYVKNFFIEYKIKKIKNL